MAGPGDDSSGKEEKKQSLNLFMQTTDLIDRNLRVVKYASVYGLAGIGVLIILRRTYALRKFGHISDVPRDFIKEHTQLRGHVVKVTHEGHLLVDHAPILSVEKFKGRKATKGKLPVSVAGVELSDLAFPWLNKNILNNHVWFTMLRVRESQKMDNIPPSSVPISDIDIHDQLHPDPVSSKEDLTIKNDNQQGTVQEQSASKTTGLDTDKNRGTEYIKSSQKLDDETKNEDSSTVTLPRVIDSKEEVKDLIETGSCQEVLDSIVLYRKNFLWNSNLNIELVRLGLATCAMIPGLHEDRDVKKLMEGLARAQKKAERKGLGIWSRPSLRERIRLYPAYLRYRTLSYIRETLNYPAYLKYKFLSYIRGKLNWKSKTKS